MPAPQQPPAAPAPTTEYVQPNCNTPAFFRSEEEPWWCTNTILDDETMSPSPAAHPPQRPAARISYHHQTTKPPHQATQSARQHHFRILSKCRRRAQDSRLLCYKEELCYLCHVDHFQQRREEDKQCQWSKEAPA